MTKKKTPYRPVAVRDVSVDRPVEDVAGLDGYDRCLAVFRYRGNVVGQAFLPVRDGRLRRESITSHLPDCASALAALLQTPGPLEPHDDPFVSVIVCTHNRAALLRHCLRSLMQLRWPKREIIVVDSHPVNEETRMVVEEFPDVRYVRSPRRGLDIARNAGIAAARGGILAFTDDDAEADPDWLGALVRSFSDPMAGMVTGITLPRELETEAQLMFERAGGFHRGYLTRELTFQHAAWAGSAGAGVNMALRRDIALEVGPFDEVLDGGTPTMSGGDHEYFSRVLARGYKIVYTPAALVWHRHRREMDSVWGALHGYGVGVYAWWTRSLLVDREYGLLLIAPVWFVQFHVRSVVRSLIGAPGAMPVRYALAEMLGALRGPFAYLQARYFSKV